MADIKTGWPPKKPAPMTTSTGDITLATVATEQKHPIPLGEVTYHTPLGMLNLAELKSALSAKKLVLNQLGDDALKVLGELNKEK